MSNKIIYLLVSIVLFSCSKDEDQSLIPIIETIGSQVHIDGGVKLEGNIINLGTEEIIDYGFELVAHGGNVSYNVDHHGELPAERGLYSLEIKHVLYPDLAYSFTAFVRTENNTYNGDRLNFISNGSVTPILNKCVPNLTHVGDTIILNGSNFPIDKNRFSLKFGDSYASIISASDEEIKFIVPNPSNSSRAIELEFNRDKASKDGLLNLHTPIISSVSPQETFFGDTLVIHGDHFNFKKQFTHISFGDINAEIISTSRNKMEVIFPKTVNYNNYQLKLYAQRENVNYNNFSIQIPKILSIPKEVYTNEYFDIKVDRIFPNRNYFYLDGRYELHSEIVNNETIRLYINTGSLFSQRENHLIWKINDKEIKSETTIKLINPFYKIKYGGFSFLEYYDTFITDSGPIFLGVNRTDVRRSLYKYNHLINEWYKTDMINIAGNPVPLGPPSSGIFYTYSKYDNAIYGLHEKQYNNNFIKINVDNGEVTYLPINHNSTFFGKGFSYKNKVFFLSGINDDLWCYNIDTESWSVVTNTHFEKGNYRELHISTVVIDDYVYFLNGSDGNLYSDFWRMNLSSYNWEKLPDIPESNKYSTAFLFRDELYSITEHIWKYNFNTKQWTEIEKSGFHSTNSPINSFIQNDIPYVIIKGGSNLNLYKGDLLE